MNSINAPSSTELSILFQVPEEHACYSDHFPGNPLVPGALLLKWFIERIETHNLSVRGIKHCKFLQIVKPGDHLQLNLSKNLDSPYVSFTCNCETVIVAKGQFEISSEGAINHE